jgi:hypothetical protein
MKQYHKNPRKISPERLDQLKEYMEELGDLSGIVHDLNSDEVISGNQRSKVIDVTKCKIELAQKFQEPDAQGTIAWGFVIWKGKKYNYRQVRWTAEQCEKANIIANKAGGSWDYEQMFKEFSAPILESLGFDDSFLTEQQESAAAVKKLLDGEGAPKLKEEKKGLRPKNYVRVLLSIPVDQAMQAKELLDQLAEIDEVEVDYGAN